MKARSSIVVLAILSLACAASVTAQTPITVLNPSFEAAVTLTNGWEAGNVPSWTCSGNFGIFAPTTSQFTSIPNGTQVGLIYGGSCSQDLGFAPVAGTVYSFSVYVGRRETSVFDTGFTVGMSVGTTSICSHSGNTNQWALMTWQLQTLTCTVPSPAPAGNLSVTLSASGNQASFDVVTVSSSAPHQTTLSWQASTTPGVSYNVYKSAGGSSCGGTSFSQIAMGLTGLTFTDTPVTLGQLLCYKVKAFDGVNESDAISLAMVTVQ